MKFSSKPQKSSTRPTGEGLRTLFASVNPTVFFTSSALILLFSLYGAIFQRHAAETFQTIQGFFISSFGWFYMLVVSLFFLFIIILAITPSGRIKLGPDDSKPDYSYGSWFAMLFSAGMGIGLMYFGVAEPLMHYASPPAGDGFTADAAREALKITMFHWGFHAWAIYIVVGLSLAYFVFRHDLPMTIRSSLYPVLKERIHGKWGDAIDIFALLSTLFGVATSLGIGVMQVNAGLNYLFGVEITTGVQVGLISGITLIATISVVAGLDKGIRRISEFNLILAIALLVFVLLAGPTISLLNTLIQNIGMYLSSFIGMSFQLYAYEPTPWMGSWTLFYWAWWISWAPFVGMFIARISRGRTIREFIVGVLFVPTGFTFLWFTFFGNGALFAEISSGTTLLSDAVSTSMPTAVFAYLQQLPWTSLTSVLATLLVVTFFVTSSDSGSLVIDMISSGGAKNPPVWQRVFWAVTEGVVAAVLLIAGGLTALQTAAITSALPFAVIMLVICYSLFRALRVDVAETEHRRRAKLLAGAGVAGVWGAGADLGGTGGATKTVGTGRANEVIGTDRVGGKSAGDGVAGMAGAAHTHWKTRLQAIMRYHRKPELQSYIKRVVRPAMKQVSRYAKELNLESDLQISQETNCLSIQVGHGDPFTYEVRLKKYSSPSYSDMPKTESFYRAEVYLMDKPMDYDVAGYTGQQLAQDIFQHLEDHVQSVPH